MRIDRNGLGIPEKKEEIIERFLGDLIMEEVPGLNFRTIEMSLIILNHCCSVVVQAERDNMLLITEVNDKQTCHRRSNGEKQYHIDGIFMQAEQKNRNGRVYPSKVLMNEVKKYTTTM